MADGIEVHNPVPTGTDEPYQVSTDQDGDGKHVQRMKLAHSANGSKEHVQADADGLLVKVSNALSVGGEVDLGAASLAALESVTAELGAASLAALESITATGPLTDAQIRATPLPVSGTFFQATQPVSAAALPLPSGAATSAKQDTLIGHVDGLEGLLAGGLPAALAAGGGLKVEGVAGGVAQPVSAASLPLPSGAATSAKQDTIIGHLDGVEALLATIDTAAAAIKTAVETLDNAIAGSEMQADVLTLPADPLGANADAIVAAGATGSISAKLRRLTQGVEDLKAGITALPSHAVTNAGTFAVQDATAQASLSVLDDWDESDRAKVNPIAGQAGVAAGAGAVGATTQRTTLASDDPAVAALQVMDDWDESDRAKVNPIAGQVGVQGGSGVVTALTQRAVLATDVALPAGTNAIGKLAANSGVDIGDVDVTSLPALVAGTANIGDVDIASIPGTPTNGAAQVTVTNSSTTIVVSRATRRKVLIVNQQTVPVYIDPSGGTAATTHFRLDPGASVTLEVTTAVTGITSAAYTASGDAKCHFVDLY